MTTGLLYALPSPFLVYRELDLKPCYTLKQDLTVPPQRIPVGDNSAGSQAIALQQEIRHRTRRQP